jgi:hypothetical protein
MADGGDKELPERHGAETDGDDDQECAAGRLLVEQLKRADLIRLRSGVVRGDLQGEPRAREVEQTVPKKSDPGQRFEHPAVRGAASTATDRGSC